MKPIIVSGIQPSGRLHIGNYLGALKNFVTLQNSLKYDCFFFIADYHSLTEQYNATKKQGQILDLTASFLAVGLNPKKATLFIQSHVSVHTELAWILNTLTPLGELNRMTQFKDKSASKNINAGLFMYPVLMAADILIYHASIVPVGNDQNQHLELARILARKFNHQFGNVFNEPKPLLTKTPRVMSLSNPDKKMSKSHPNGCLFIDDDLTIIRKKIMSAVTDSKNKIIFNPTLQPGLANLLSITAAFTETTPEEIAKKYAKSDYGKLKEDLTNLVNNHFTTFRKKKVALLKNPSKLIKIFSSGDKIANKIASKNLVDIKTKIGLL